MLADGHLETAKELEESAKALLSDPDKHTKAIVEILFGAAHHYIACGLERKHKGHSDHHADDSGLLRRRGEEEMAEIFESIDRLRAGRFYGKKRDGEIVTQMFELLEEVKRWVG
jgi:hypothetical protein